jgi:RNA polymerase sigma factor (sigma-70 family)
MSDPIGSLLEKLCQGDAAAAEQVFRTYEPCLRLVVRRHLPPRLRAKFDSIDIVQSVWADLLDGFRDAGWRFTDAAHLRAFLIRLTRNRFIDRVRQQRRSLTGEQHLPGTGLEETLPGREFEPIAILQAKELWEQILLICPPAHREVLHMKRQGIPLREIAERTGLHPSSVRRILYDLARRLSRRRQEETPTASAGR